MIPDTIYLFYHTQNNINYCWKVYISLNCICLVHMCLYNHNFLLLFCLISFGILGKSLKQLSHSTLIPHGEQKNNKNEAVNYINNNSEDHSGIRVQGSMSSFMVPK